MTRTHHVRHAVLGIVGREERSEKHDDGGGVEEPGLDEDAHDAGQLAVPADAGDVLRGDPVVDLQDAVVCKQVAMDAAALRAAADVAERTVLKAFC